LGVDISNLVLAQPDYGEQALEIAEQLASTGAVKLIVVDSVAALTPKAEVEGDMSDQQMGLQARMMSK
jgi:recombination protein RecA